MRFKPTIKGITTFLVILVLSIITIIAASAVSEFSISGFEEWDSSAINTFSANITGLPYLSPYAAALYAFNWTTSDSSGNGNDGVLNGYTLNNGTISGATTGVSGVYGEGVSFVSSNIITTPLLSNLNTYTIGLWVYSDSANTGSRVPIMGADPVNDDWIGLSSNTGLRMEFADGTDTFTFVDGVPYNTWTYITYVYNGTHILFYKNASLLEVVSRIGKSSNINFIGKGYSSVYFVGAIDEFRIWNGTILSQTEIETEMNSHYPIETPVLSYSFETYNASHVFDTNWNVQGQDDNETGAISFNGSQTVNLNSDLSATQDFSLSTWVLPTGGNGWIVGDKFSYRIYDGGGSFTFLVTNNTPSDGFAEYTYPSSSVWYHVVGTYNGSDVLLYVNGVLRDSDTLSGDIRTRTEKTFLGSRDGADTFFTGSLSDVRIYDRALSADEVGYLYDSQAITYALSTSDGTLETQIPNSSPYTYNISVAATDYFPQSFTSQNVSSNLSVQFNQSIITFDSFEKFTNNSLSSTYTVTHNDYADGGYYNNGRNWGSASPLTRTWTSGMSFVVNDDYLKLKSATVDVSENGATKAYLLLGDYNGTILETTTNRSGNIFYFTYNNNLLKGQEYTILANNDGNSWDISYESGSTLPESFDKFNWSYSYDDGNTARTDIIVIWEFLNFSKYDGKNSWTITENETINLPVNTGWNVTASTGSYYDKTATFNVTALDNKTENVTGLFDTYFNVSAKDSFNNNSINNFNLSITSSIFNQSYEVTNYELIEAITGYSYTASAISTSNFLLGTDTITPTTNLELWVLFLDPYNSVNITFREYDDTIINTTTINITIIDGTTATNYNTTNGTLQLRLLTPNDYELRTTASGYNDRKYYFTVTNDSTQNINIYLEENVSTELQQIRILDTTNTEVTGAIVRVEKETTLGSNLWSNYAEETTNAEGIANTYLEKGINNYYRFAVFVNGAVIPIYPSGADYTVKTNFISGVTEIVDIVINLQAVEITDYYEELYSVSTNMGFVGNDTVWFSWVDAQNTISGAKLVIRGKYIDNTTAYELINTQTSSATSGNITYTFTPINNTIYQAYGYIIYSDRESLAQTATKSYGVTSFVEKNTGLLLAVLILAVTAFLTVSFGVLLSGVMTVLMLVFTNIIGLTNFPTTIITSLLALFIILLIRITKGDEG